MTLPFDPLKPTRDKATMRKLLQAERQSMMDRLQRTDQLQDVLRIWLTKRPDVTVGAYWPIKGEFDPLPALYRWTEGAGKGEETEIIGGRVGAAAVERERARFRSFLVIGFDLRIGFRSEIGEQIVLLAELDSDLGTLRDLPRRLQQLLDEDVDRSGVGGEILRGGEQRLIGGGEVFHREYRKLAWRLLL